MKKISDSRLFFVVMQVFALCFCIVFVTNNNAFAADPVLFFSDLTWGPKTGWEGATTKGAAVTIWGGNFGSATGSSKITINGADITSTNSTYIAEWNATGPARNTSRITFWVPSTAISGSGTISVTVGGVTSNTLPFNITAGTIYFIAASDGSDSYNGLYATRTGHTGSDGPFKNALKFNPSNGAGDSQYIMYIRQGTYSTLDTWDAGGGTALIQLYGPFGGATKQKALIAYPTEVPTMSLVNAHYGVVYQNSDSGAPNGGGPDDYFTFAKLYMDGSGITYPQGLLSTYGQYNRIIGCTVQNFRPTAQLQSGFIWVGASQYASIYGNYLYNNGYDSYAHNIYIKTQQENYPTSGVNVLTQNIDVGWNEFSNAYASDTHGGVIFVSKGGTNPPAGDTKFISIHDNYFHDGNMDFIYTGDGYTFVDEIYVYNNIFKGGTGGTGITVQNGTKNVYYYNNTFYQIGTSSAPMVYHNQGTGQSHFMNNIFYSNNNQTFLYLEPYNGATMSSDHDLFYNPVGTTTVPGGSIAVTNARTGNPLFVVNGADLHLQSNSPAINTGISTSPTVTKDYDGNLRSTGADDIGAFEYVSGSPPPTPPAAPTGLSVQ